MSDKIFDKIFNKTFDRICEKLFGTTREHQEKRLIKLMIITLIVFFAAMVLNFPGVVVLFIWGWRALCACVGVTEVSKFFQYNPVVIAIALAIWILLGGFAGVVVFMVGIIRLVQFGIERYKKWKKDEEKLDSISKDSAVNKNTEK